MDTTINVSGKKLKVVTKTYVKKTKNCEKGSDKKGVYKKRKKRCNQIKDLNPGHLENLYNLRLMLNHCATKSAIEYCGQL